MIGFSLVITRAGCTEIAQIMYDNMSGLCKKNRRKKGKKLQLRVVFYLLNEIVNFLYKVEILSVTSGYKHSTFTLHTYIF